MAESRQNSIDDVRLALAAERLRPRELRSLWYQRVPVAFNRIETPSLRPPAGLANGVPWLQEDASLARAFIGHTLQRGAFHLACDAARETLRVREDALVQQQLAVALLRLGSMAEARSVLRGLLDDRAGTDAVGAALLHRLMGDCFYYEALRAGEEELVRADLGNAFAEYEAARCVAPSDFRCLARAASVALLLSGSHGLADEAGTGVSRAVSEALAERCLRVLDDGQGDTGFEALLEKASALCVLGRVDETEGVLDAAIQHRLASPHVLCRARDHLRLLAEAGGIVPSTFDHCFPPLRLLVFSGHLPDEPGRASERFPAAAEPDARELIGEEIDDVVPCVGFSSAAAGADLLFSQELDRFGQQARFVPEHHIVLPWSEDAFIASSVSPFGDEWVARFRMATGRADSLRILGEPDAPTDAAGFDYTNVVMGGLAKIEARVQGFEVVPLVFWNGDAGKTGGTGSFVEFWQRQGIETRQISSVEALRRYRARVGKTVSVPPRSSIAPAPVSAGKASRATLGRELKTMLFADVVGYSRLSEAVVPAYIERFMGLVSRLVAGSSRTPVSVNTWGDAIYFVFDSAEAGGVFALDLLEEVVKTDWIEAGVYFEDRSGGDPVPLSLRTALHTGPVYTHFDPIVRRLGFTGAHVNRTARIEPVTPRAAIYCSEEFAAIAAAEGVADFSCDFVGTMPLAKNYPGDFKLYQLRRLRNFPLDLLARAIHEAYREEQARKQQSSPSDISVLPWSELPIGFKDENRAQAAHIKTKLFALGYELRPGPQGAAQRMQMDDAEIEFLARQEHQRWCDSKRRKGWRFGPRDDANKLHPSLVPWNELPESEKQKDRDPVRNLPRLLALAGFQAVAFESQV